MDMSDSHAAKQNLRQVVYNGRNTLTRLCRNGRQTSLKSWAREIIDQMTPIAEFFDRSHGGSNYRDTLQRQLEKVLQPDMTPAAQVMEKLASRQQSFFAFAMNQAQAHRDHFRARPLDTDVLREMETTAADSLSAQQELEASPQVPFEQYLADYFAD